MINVLPGHTSQNLQNVQINMQVMAHRNIEITKTQRMNIQANKQTT